MNKTRGTADMQAWNVARTLNRTIIAKDENSVWSPACLAYLLAVIREGASGRTKDELSHLVGDSSFLDGPDPLGLLAARGSYRNYEASSVCAAWLAQTATPGCDFLRTCEKAGIRITIENLADPRVGPEISAWIKKKTRGLLSPTITLSPLTLACLVSTLYLKDAWREPFDVSMTGERTFYAPNGKVKAPFMHGLGDYLVLDGSIGVAVCVPLCSGARVLFALPNRICRDSSTTLKLFERLARDEGSWQYVDLRIPRFSCETASVDLNSVLRAAGVSTIGSMELLPMVGQTETPTQILHGAKLTVDERGIEAGAYSAMVALAGALPMKRPRPRKIVFNKPFVVAVLSRTGTPLFVGSVAKPQTVN